MSGGEPLPPDVRERLRRAVAGAGDPVEAVRELRRAAVRLPGRYRGQRDAVRWEAELALRPFWRGLTGDRAAKAAAWAALDGLWDSHTPPDAASAERSGRRDGAREPASRLACRWPDPLRAGRDTGTEAAC